MIRFKHEPKLVSHVGVIIWLRLMFVIFRLLYLSLRKRLVCILILLHDMSSDHAIKKDKQIILFKNIVD